MNGPNTLLIRPNMYPNNDVMNASEVSEWLRIPKSTLYKLCSEGQIPCTKIGKHWRFDRAVVESWFRKRVKEGMEASVKIY